MKTMQELYAMKHALEAKGFPERDACRIVVSRTGQRLNDGKRVGTTVDESRLKR